MPQICPRRRQLTKPRVCALEMLDWIDHSDMIVHTLVAIDTVKWLHHDIGATTSHMDKWPLLTEPEPGCNREALV